MTRFCGAFLIAVLSTFSADTLGDAVDDLLLEIKNTTQTNQELFNELQTIKSNISEVDKLIKNFDLFYNWAKLNLTEKEENYLKQTASLIKTITVLENEISVEKDKLRITELFGYRLEFVLGLLHQDLKFLNERKLNGHQVLCYEFEKNKTEIFKSNLLNLQFKMNLGTYEHKDSVQNVAIHRLELSKALIDKEAVTREILVHQQELEQKIRFQKYLEVVSTETLEKIKELLSKAEDVLVTLEKHLKSKYEEYVYLLEKSRAKKESNKNMVVKIVQTKKEIVEFEEAINCYSKIESYF